MGIFIQALGGIGVFLLGMVIMTDGLKALAGARLSRFLVNATRSPLSGAITGSISTAILQSSSATTVAAVGFVSAGLLSFTQALGIIFGANLGTTVTGWMVALLGFKLKLGSVLLPLIFIGIMLRLFARGRLAQVGYSLAGFGLIFVGIGLLQQAAGNIQIIDPNQLPGDSLGGRLQLVAIGIIATVITQSSSAGVAMTLVAVNAGLIQFEQAAALVIGMDIGTTVTAVMATIGSSLSTRRTGYSHVIYNFLTALLALILISPFVLLWQSLGGQPIEDNAEIALVAFHSFFNLIGVSAILPFATPFAQLVEKLIPPRDSDADVGLDTALLREPSVALRTVEHIITRELLTLLHNINLVFEEHSDRLRANMQRMQRTLDETHQFLDQIHIREADDPDAPRLVALIHAIDHMQRLHERCDEELERAITASRHQALSEVETIFDQHIEDIIQAIQSADWGAALSLAETSHRKIDDLEHPQRDKIYLAVARGEMTVPEATECAEALRWLSRVSRHSARICRYLAQANH